MKNHAVNSYMITGHVLLIIPGQINNNLLKVGQIVKLNYLVEISLKIIKLANKHRRFSSALFTQAGEFLVRL